MEHIFDLPFGSVALKLPKGVHIPPPSTVELARLLDVHPGDRVLELGCGCGLLSIVAARLGAKQVIATDLNPLALETTAENARTNGVSSIITLYQGSWYDALPDHDKGPFDIIAAIAPQTPGPSNFGPRYGGWDGTDNLRIIIEGAPSYLIFPSGRIWLHAISLVDFSQVMRHLQEQFRDVTLLKETERHFVPEEYEGLAPGLFEHLKFLRNAGKADFDVFTDGGFVFRNYFIRAAGARHR
mgnify:CR=1 FL=1